MASIRRHALAALCSMAALSIPTAAQADSLRADLDGDGIRDRIEVSARPDELAVRFAASRRLVRLEADDLILKFVVADVDRDGDPDIVADTPGSGLQLWINKGGGLFATRSRHLRTHPLPGSPQDARPSVHGLPNRTDDDSAVNDPTRLFIVLPGRAGERLIGVCGAPSVRRAPLSTLVYRHHTARGPPPSLVS